MAKIIEGEINSHGIDLVRSFFLIVMNIIISSFLIYLFVLDEFLSSVLLWFLGLLIFMCWGSEVIGFSGRCYKLERLCFVSQICGISSKISFFMWAFCRLLLLIDMVFQVIVIIVMCIMEYGKLNFDLFIYIYLLFIIYKKKKKKKNLLFITVRCLAFTFIWHIT